MARSVIDEFVVALGIDSTAFDRGARDAQDRTRRMREDVNRNTNDIERSGKRISRVFRSARNEIVGFVAAFAGANAIKSLITDLVTGAAAAGRLASNVGVAVENVYGVRYAARAENGSDADADSALRTLSQAYQSYRLTGDTGFNADLQGLGVSLETLKNPAETLERIAANADRLSRPEFVERLRRIGLPESVINSLARGSDGYRKLTAEGERLSKTQEDEARQAQKVQEEWNRMVTTIKGYLTPVIFDLIKRLNETIDSMGGVEGAIETLRPVLIAGAVLIGALALQAGVAAAPFVALSAAILGLKTAIDSLIESNPKLESWLDRMEEPFKKYLPEWMFERPHRQGAASGGSASAGTPPVANGSVSGLYNNLLAKYGKERADGIWAGIGAESRWDPNAVNPTSGAYGLGQWLGSRKRELFRRYGRNPTAAQQIEFLMWELEGGDPGGRKVLAQTDRDGALVSYINDFMRPAKGSETSGDLARGRAILGGGGNLARARPGMSSGGGSNSSVSTSTTVGQIVVYSPDPMRAGQNVQEAIRNRRLVVQANSGMSQ